MIQAGEFQTEFGKIRRNDATMAPKTPGGESILKT